MEGFFNILYDLGLGTPLARGIFGAVVGLIPVFFKSSLFYVHEGNGVVTPKVFAPFAGEKTDPRQKTFFPWYLLPLILAIVFSVFL